MLKAALLNRSSITRTPLQQSVIALHQLAVLPRVPAHNPQPTKGVSSLMAIKQRQRYLGAAAAFFAFAASILACSSLANLASVPSYLLAWRQSMRL